MKRFPYTIGLAILITLSFTLPFTTSAASKQQTDGLELTEHAKASILLERDTGEILYEKNAHEKLPPASMTKVMTMLLIMEAIAQDKVSVDEQITISEYASSMGGSQVFLAAGEQMSVHDLIKGIAIASGNDASVAMAERIAGSEASFVQLMNDRVKELGLSNTHFMNASGLPKENHYSTAYDMAMIAKELLKYEDIITYTSIYEDYLRKGQENEFWLVNTNKLVRFYPYVDGLKTGFTAEAKFCLTATAKKNDMRVVTVVMGADTAKKRNAETMNLIDYAFNHFETEKFFDQGDKVANFHHLQSEKLNYDVRTSEQISVLHKKGEQTENGLQSEVKLKEDIKLPVGKGEEVGTLILKKDNKKYLESPLIIEESVEVASFYTLWKRSIQNLAKYNGNDKISLENK